MNKRGIAMMQFNHVVDWAQVATVRPRCILIMDPGHYEDARRVVGVDGLVVWRPTEPAKPLHQHFWGVQWADWIASHWPYAGRLPDAVQWLNEPNLEIEWGYPAGNLDGARFLNEWGSGCAFRLSQLWPSVKILTPPLSTAHFANDLQYATEISPLVSLVEDLGGWYCAHSYWATPAGLYDPKWNGDEAFRYRKYHGMYPSMPMLVGECNRPASGAEVYGAELHDYMTAIEADEYVKAACVFVWDAPDGMYDEYVLARTPARYRWVELVGGGTTRFRCPSCGAELRVGCV